MRVSGRPEKSTAPRFDNILSYNQGRDRKTDYPKILLRKSGEVTFFFCFFSFTLRSNKDENFRSLHLPRVAPLS